MNWSFPEVNINSNNQKTLTVCIVSQCCSMERRDDKLRKNCSTANWKYTALLDGDVLSHLAVDRTLPS